MLYGLGFALIFAGVVITLVAVVLLFMSGLTASGEGKGEVKGGGAVIVGPFPIIFGSDKESVKTILWLSIALTVLLTIVTVVFHLLSE